MDEMDDIQTGELPDFTVEDASAELATNVNLAVNFMISEFSEEWEKAQEYYNGQTDLPVVRGRSQAVDTVVRDMIRNARPSLMRIFLHSDSIVDFIPSGGPVAAKIAKQQSQFANQQFFAAGGDTAIYGCIQNAMLKKFGVLKYWYNNTDSLSYLDLQDITETELQSIYTREDVAVLSVEESGTRNVGQQPIALYNCSIAQTSEQGSIKVENVPLEEFFFDDAATSIHDFSVMGHRRPMFISDLLALGIDYTDLESLDYYDPETSDQSGESYARRGYSKQRDQQADTKDPMMQKVLVTEVYVRYDLEGIGIPQLYRFWLGGSSYEYLTHERADMVPFGILAIDPEPNTIAGKSLFDVLKSRQDVQTSLLRATIDNAHMANNRRLAVHEQMVNLDDVLNPAVGAPIRVRAAGQIQEIGVTSSVGAMLPLLQHLQTTTENQAGVTSAAMGLDHDALQSTTKEAAMNTIQLSQGQIEVMARNIAAGLMDVFRGILKLSMWHLPRQQIIRVSGDFVPVDQAMFNPDLYMRPNVGLGTGDQTQKIAGLNAILAQQKEIMATMGASNPIVSMKNIYATIEDLAKLYGIHDVARYFNPVTPEVEQGMAKQAQAAAEQQRQAIDPGLALVQAEQIKSEQRREEMKLEAVIKTRDKALDQQFEALKFAAQNDLERDKMAQEREIAASRAALDVAKLKKEQEAPRPDPLASGAA